MTGISEVDELKRRISNLEFEVKALRNAVVTNSTVDLRSPQNRYLDPNLPGQYLTPAAGQRNADDGA